LPDLNDFIIDKFPEVIPLEVKYRKLPEVEMTRSYQSFLAKYQPQTGYIVHLGDKSEKQVRNTLVKYLPYYQFIFQVLRL